MQLQPSGDLMAVRRILEPAAILDLPAAQVQACARRSAELVAQMRTALSRGQTSRVVELHTEFHLVLVRYGSSRLLRTLTTTMILASTRWQAGILRETGAARQWMNLHAGIVEALEGGDIEVAAQRIADHMQTRFAFRREAGAPDEG
jgi:DNA-binding GntR family transcriptional regulator